MLAGKSNTRARFGQALERLSKQQGGNTTGLRDSIQSEQVVRETPKDLQIAGVHISSNKSREIIQMGPS